MLEPGSNPSTGQRRCFDLRVCLALALAGLLVYNVNQRVISSGDNYPARFLPFSILGYHTLCLDPIIGVVSQGRASPYWVIRGRGGRLVSQYPVVTPLLVSPLYLPAIAYLHARGWTDGRVDRLARLMEKVSASVIASLSVALMYLLLRRRLEVRAALLLAVAYGFGTNTWMIGSQGLWQHGTGELLLTAALLLVTGPCAGWRALAAGALCALAAFNRPPDAILAAPIGLYGLWWAGRRAWLVVAGGLAVSAPLLAYNIGVVGSVLGGYAIVEGGDFFRFSLPLGVAGLLFSPGRGLFLFTPFLLALPLGLWRAPRERAGRWLTISLCIAVVIQVAVYAKADWRGGASWGPRYLTDALPLLVWLLAPAVAGMGRGGRAAFGAAVCASIAVQAAGAFWYTGKSDEAMRSTLGDPASMKAVWNLRSTPFIFELRHRPAPRDLLLKLEGRIENVKAGGREVAQAAAGTEIAVEGWALANRRAPARVVATLVPDRRTNRNPVAANPIADARIFQPRADVDAAMRTSAPCGWSIVLQTAGLPPGDYVIEVLAQGDDGGEFHPVGLRPFKLLPAGEGGK